MSVQVRSNVDAYGIVCRTYYKCKRAKRKKLPNLVRIGVLDFNLTRSEAVDIQTRERYTDEALMLKECGGGFMRGGRVRQRSSEHGRLI